MALERAKRPPVVLIACDQEWSMRSLESILGPRGYAVIRGYTGRQSIELARTTEPDAVILDARLPDLDGIDVCRMLRGKEWFSATTPIVMLAAGQATRAQRLPAYEAGVWEYCNQPLDGDLLVAKLDTFLRSKIEVDHIRGESLIDDLTGLYNVKGIARRAREIGAEAFRTHHALACVALGPETTTRPASDEEQRLLEVKLAQAVGGVMREAGRASDAIGRLGQTEFAIVAPSTELPGAERMIERLRERMRDLAVHTEGSVHAVRLRAGYTAVEDMAASAVDADEMLLRAVRALNQTRADGGETFTRSYDHSMDAAEMGGP